MHFLSDVDSQGAGPGRHLRRIGREDEGDLLKQQIR
jgi:hypothetical protein